MRIYLSVDMEGASGVTRWSDVIARGQDYQRARGWMTGDVRAAIEGARRIGPIDFVVEENHGTEDLCNLLLDELPEDVEVVRGLPRGGATTAAALDDSYDAMFLVAHHARAGAYPGFCAHTISYDSYAEVRVNGRPVGETYLFAMMAAQRGVPTALVTGDQCVAAEVTTVAPEAEAAVVKEAMSRSAGRLLTPRRGAAVIASAAERAATRIREHAITVPTVDAPFRCEVELREPPGAEGRAVLEESEGFELVSERVVAFGHDEMSVVFRMAAATQVLASGRRWRGW